MALRGHEIERLKTCGFLQLEIVREPKRIGVQVPSTWVIGEIHLGRGENRHVVPLYFAVALWLVCCGGTALFVQFRYSPRSLHYSMPIQESAICTTITVLIDTLVLYLNT